MSRTQRAKNEELDLRAEAVLRHVRISDLLTVMGIEFDGSSSKIVCIFPEHSERTGSMKVYVETDSVHCFGCGNSGNVINIVQRCAAQGNQRWSRERAINWLEQKFGIQPPPRTQGLADQLNSRLSKWKRKRKEDLTQSVTREMAEQSILRAFDEAQRGITGEIRAALGGFEDYIWGEFERPGVDYSEWLTLSLPLIRGYYTNARASLDLLPVQPSTDAGRHDRHGARGAVPSLQSLLSSLRRQDGAPDPTVPTHIP